MKSPRLLPIVIAATTALLLLKAIGLVTGGGYVLTGTTEAVAASGHSAPAAGDRADPTMQLPPDATLSDSSPTLDGKEPTLPLVQGESGAHGEQQPEHSVTEENSVATGAEHKDEAAHEPSPCPAVPAPAEAGHGGQEKLEGFNFALDPGCKVDPGKTADGDALPLIKNGEGQLVPLADVDPEVGSETAIVERLGERREALDQREKELDMRLALVEAAEKRIDERTATLKALEEKINSLLAEKKAADEKQFVNVVAMYETMKPKEAAGIFDKLDVPVLLQVARAMNPRKLAPILAKMDPVVAKTLTAGLAAEQPTSPDEISESDLASLPQIVGQ